MNRPRLIPLRFRRPATAALASLGLGLGLGLLAAVDGPVARAQGGPMTSPCRLELHLELSDKLACPLDSVTFTLQLRAACPLEADGSRSEVVEVLLDSPLTGNLRGNGWSLAGDGEADGARHLGPVPDEGLLWRQRLFALRSGVYQVGAGLRLELRDDKGRSAEAFVSEPVELVVNPCGYGGPDRKRQLYLPWVQRPRCAVSAQAADIVLAIDRSTSMGQAGLALTLEQARSFIESVDLERDRVAILAFDREPTLVSGLTEDRLLLLAALRAVVPGRLTAIDRAIDASIGVLGPGGNSRRRVLALVSDGHQTGLGDEAAVRAAALRARRSGIRILTLAVDGKDVDPNWALLRDLTESASRSVRVRGGDASLLSQAFRDLAELSGCGD